MQLRLAGASPYPIGQGSIIFLGQRISPGGNHRLVCLRYHPESQWFTGRFFPQHNVEITCTYPGTLTKWPSAHMQGAAYSILLQTPKIPPRVRVYAGQIDPKDASHFTIRYEMWGQSDFVDGWLSDNDAIRLVQRNPPHEPKR
jgi:hypothetical protein